MKDQIIAFAALCQIASAVQSLARTGTLEQKELALFLASIGNVDPEDTLSVYGNDLANLRVGLNVIVQQLGNSSQPKDPELTRYIVNLIALERKLSKSSARLAQLGERLNDISRQLAHYDITSDNVLANLAGIYSDLISPLGHKIQITGDATILSQPINQHKIRALLLAGIRAVVLWRQLGGKRRHILFSRRKILSHAEHLLTQI